MFIFDSHFRKHWNATVVMVTGRFPTRLMSLMFFIPRSVLPALFKWSVRHTRHTASSCRRREKKVRDAVCLSRTDDCRWTRAEFLLRCVFVYGRRPPVRATVSTWSGRSEQPMLARFWHSTSPLMGSSSCQLLKFSPVNTLKWNWSSQGDAFLCF